MAKGFVTNLTTLFGMTGEYGRAFNIFFITPEFQVRCESASSQKYLVCLAPQTSSNSTIEEKLKHGRLFRQRLFKYTPFVYPISFQLISDWPENQLTELANVLELRHYRPGDSVVRQGTTADCMFFVQQASF